MKTFSQHTQEKLEILRKDRLIVDTVHAYAYLDYLLEKLKQYLMSDEEPDSFEEENEELIKWFSYIAALAQHSVEQLRLLEKEDVSEPPENKIEDEYLISTIKNIFSHIISNKKECRNPPQKSQQRWWDVPFNEDQIQHLDRLIREKEKNDSIEENNSVSE